MVEHLPYRVEPMTLSDIPQVIEIEQAAFPTPWSARAYRYEVVENENSTMLAVRPGGGPLTGLVRHLGFVPSGPILAYGGFWLLDNEAHIATLAVHPERRREGLGELLLVSLLEQAMAQGAWRSTLEVRVSNRPAQKLYEKYGFRKEARRRRYYTDTNEDGYFMGTPPFARPDFQRNLTQRRADLYARLQAPVHTG